MRFGLTHLVAVVALAFSPTARAQDRLLDETVSLTGAVLYLSLGVPGLVIGVVQNGRTAVAGYGRFAAYTVWTT